MTTVVIVMTMTVMMTVMMGYHQKMMMTAVLVMSAPQHLVVAMMLLVDAGGGGGPSSPRRGQGHTSQGESICILSRSTNRASQSRRQLCSKQHPRGVLTQAGVVSWHLRGRGTTWWGVQVLPANQSCTLSKGGIEGIQRVQTIMRNPRLRVIMRGG
jgi:hypothetical protein